MSGLPLVDIAFEGRVIEWRGPAPFYFVAVPDASVGEIRFAARQASYGWGCVPVEAEIAGNRFATSLFPRDDTYLLPVKAAVRAAVGLALGDRVRIALRIRMPGD